MATCKSEKQGGYNCELVEQPPKYLQVECPVCLQILRDPYVISCCGYYFCKVCIKRVQDDNKPCPTCNEQNFTVLANKGHQRMLNGFVVQCSNEKDGCKWTGELGSLDDHINANPEDTKQLDGCDYTQVNCAYCDNSFKRIEIENHQKNDCPKRPFTCEYCLTYKTNYDDVVNSHWSVCDSKPVPCPNKCGENALREDLDDHIADTCPLTLVECEFPGCTADKMPRKCMAEHLQKESTKHMSALCRMYKQLECENKTLRMQVSKLENTLENTVAHLEIVQQRVDAHHDYGDNTFYFTVRNLKDLTKNNGNTNFKPFYTNCRDSGYYKMYFEAGFVQEGYLAIRVYLMQGEFDDNLKWPVEGNFEVHSKNWKRDIYDKQLKTVTFVARRLKEYKRLFLNNGNTLTLRVPISSDYVASDCLHLRIVFFL